MGVEWGSRGGGKLPCYPFVHLHMRPSVRPSVHPSVHPSIHLSVSLCSYSLTHSLSLSISISLSLSPFSLSLSLYHFMFKKCKGGKGGKIIVLVPCSTSN